MNESIIAELHELGTSAILFGKEQLPDVLEQVVALAAVSSYIYVAFGVFLMGAGAALLRAAFKSDDEDVTGCCFTVGCVSGFIGGVFIVRNIHTLITVTVAPKVYVIEYLSKLIS
jgi:hypothetical protein